MATNLKDSTEYFKRHALLMLEDIRRELEVTTEFSNPSLNYNSVINFDVAVALQRIAGKLAVANREERKWTADPLNPANKDKA